MRGDLNYALTKKQYKNKLVPVILGDDVDAAWMADAPWVVKGLNAVVVGSKITTAKLNKAGKQVAQALRFPAKKG
ncbi:MAG: hypothetical protein ACJ79H_19095 [Myxococcales bacterium]